jgi:putative effector of murein hydrolase
MAGGTVLDPFGPVRYRRTPQRLAELDAMAGLAPPAGAQARAELLARSPLGVDLRRLAAACGACDIAAPEDLPADLLRSLAPKSVTAPVAMGIAEQLGGIPALAAVFAVLTGLVGAVSGKYLFDAMGPMAPQVRGFALGTASHGIGAARAMQEHADSGAYAGLALGVQVLLSALLMPLVARWL